MRRTPAWIPVALALALLVGAGGCTSDAAAAKPPVCQSADEVQNTVDHIRDINVSENGLTALKPYLTELRDRLTQLYTDAKAQFATQADQLKSAADQLGAALRTAQGDPTALNLAAVRTAMTALRTSWQNLRTAMADTC